MKKSSVVAWALLFLLAFIWGSSFILIKKGLVGLTAAEVGSLRIVSASLFLLPFALLRLKKTAKEKLPYLLGSGLLGSLIPSFLFAIAQTRLESAITGVLNGLVPIFTILIALVLFKQRQEVKVWIGVIIGFIGTSILVTAGGEGFSGVNVFALLVVLATFCYASNLNLIKIHLSKVHALSVTSISLMFVGPFALVYLIGFTEFFEKLSVNTATQMSAFYIALLGILGTAIALVIFNKILQLTNALFASSVTYIIPVFAVMWGVLDGESLYLLHYVGMAAVGTGVYVANANRAAYKKAGSTR
jgi:drug/metabolite transporter (DMT)-like permease